MEGKLHKPQKWFVPFFQEDFTQTGLLQSFSIEFPSNDEKNSVCSSSITIKKMLGHCWTWYSSSSLCCTQRVGKPVSFSVCRREELPNILLCFLLDPSLHTRLAVPESGLPIAFPALNSETRRDPVHLLASFFPLAVFLVMFLFWTI